MNGGRLSRCQHTGNAFMGPVLTKLRKAESLLTRIPKFVIRARARPRHRARPYLLGFCVEKRSDGSAIILFLHCDPRDIQESRTTTSTSTTSQLRY
jgi:hypothetical protein